MGKTSRDKVLQEIKVTEANELLEFLGEKKVRKSRNAIKSLLAHKQIKVNGKIATQYNQQLEAGDIVSVMRFDQSRKERKLQGVKIVFEDDYLIVVDKDSGVLSVATEKEKTRTVYSVLNEYVKKKKKDNRVFVLHRLDRGVSGLIVFAKDADIQGYFQNQWDNFVLKYTYTGVVEGVIRQKQDTIVSWLTENKNFQVFSSEKDNGGQKAVTHYNVIKSNRHNTLVDFILETKRKNQIRVQMQYMEHPIVGDKKYGASGNPIKRLALHASEMILKHPVTGEIMEFKSPIPKNMQRLVERE